jgi:uncharacterized protein YndB with AHSA1/START domain
MKKLTFCKSIVIASDRETIFDALTDPEKIVNFFPVERIESDRKLGGSYKVFGTHESIPFVDHGIIEAYEPAKSFVYNYWSDNHGTENKPENRLTLGYHLSGNDPVRLTVVQENLPSKEYLKIMDPMWDMLLAAIKRYIEVG